MEGINRKTKGQNKGTNGHNPYTPLYMFEGSESIKDIQIEEEEGGVENVNMEIEVNNASEEELREFEMILDEATRKMIQKRKRNREEIILEKKGAYKMKEALGQFINK